MTVNDTAICLWHFSHGEDFDRTADYFGLPVAVIVAAILRTNAVRRRIDHNDR